MDGFLVVNKAEGWTSNDVVVKCRNLLKESKVGHLGTLDPMATGVLVLTIGKATKTFESFKSKDKEYIARIKFGILTDSLDITGKIEEVDNEASQKVNELAIRKNLDKFIGKISQIPPKFSAKKINGKKAYDLAREKKEVVLAPCEVEIKSFNLISFDLTSLEGEFQIVCSGGTYIRSLARDLGESLNTVATLTKLERTRVGYFHIDEAIDNSELKKENIEKIQKSILHLNL